MDSGLAVPLWTSGTMPALLNIQTPQSFKLRQAVQQSSQLSQLGVRSETVKHKANRSIFVRA